MNNQIYSKKNNAFYLLSMKAQYESAGAWPTDGVSVSDSMFNEFASPAPAGKIRVAGNNGLPEWGDIPPASREQLIAGVEKYRQALLNNADIVIADWRTELMLGEIKDDDKVKLSAWMTYKRNVKAVDADDAIVSGFSWPDIPTE